MLLRDELTPAEYAGVFRSSVLMLSKVSLRPLLTELLSSQLSTSPCSSLLPRWVASREEAASGARPVFRA